MLKWKYCKKFVSKTEGVFLKCHKANIGSFAVVCMRKRYKYPWKSSPHYWELSLFPNYMYEPYFSRHWLYVGNLDLRRAKKAAEKKIKKVLKEHTSYASVREKNLSRMNKSIEKVLCQDL